MEGTVARLSPLFGRGVPAPAWQGAGQPGAIEGIDAIEAAARDGAEHEVFVRVAGAGDKIYLDLVNSAWTVVEIDATGWRVISNPPVRFIRPRGLRPLPEPKKSTNFAGIRKLEELVNLQGDRFQALCRLDRRLPTAGGHLCGTGALGGTGDGKGAGRSGSACDLIDPCKVKISGPPRSEAGPRNRRQQTAGSCPTTISARSTAGFADALCRLSTGGGLQKRMLFTER